jgi:excisionase family DNA binding protein
MKIQNKPLTEKSISTEPKNAFGLLRIKEAARAMGVSEKLIRTQIMRGALPFRKFGRIFFIHKDDLLPPRVASRSEILG